MVSIAAIVIFSLSYINLSEQSSFFEKNYADKSITLAKSLDASISYYLQNQLNQTDTLQHHINTICDTNNEILTLNINEPTSQDQFTTIASNHNELINMSVNPYNKYAYENNVAVYLPLHRNSSHLITVFVPLNL